MKWTEKECIVCKEGYLAKRPYQKYCSTSCKAVGAKIKRNVKDLSCTVCGTPFRRTCAKNIKCKECKKKLKTPPKRVADEDIPKCSREDELAMQRAWLKKNKVKTA